MEQWINSGFIPFVLQIWRNHQSKQLMPSAEDGEIKGVSLEPNNGKTMYQGMETGKVEDPEPVLTQSNTEQ